MLDAVIILIAIASGSMCAEIPVTRAPAPVYRPESEQPQADAPAHGTEDTGPQRRDPFSVDLMANHEAYNLQERNKHQAMLGVQEVAVGGHGGYPSGPPAPAQEVTYPDVAYAPGYGYEPAYGNQQAFDRYGNAVGFYEQDSEPYSPPTALGLLWSTLPDARSVAGAVGRGISFALSSAFLVALGAALTVAVCSFTGLCAVTFRGLPAAEQVRALVSDERLQQLGAAAGVLHRALAKYGSVKREAARS